MFTYAPTRLLFILLLTAGLSSCLEDSPNVGSDSGSSAVIDPTTSPPVKAIRAICDPFETNSPQARDHGLFGNIFYLNHKDSDDNDDHDGNKDKDTKKNVSSKGKEDNNDKDESKDKDKKEDKDDNKNVSNNDKDKNEDKDNNEDDNKKHKSVEDYIKNGILADAVIYLDRVFVQEHKLKKSFVTMSGDQLPLHDKKLYKGFAISVESQLKLGANEQPGYYQLALIADEGALLKTIGADGSEKIIVDNDGRHATKMACATEPVYLDHNTRIPIKLQHYQEKGNHISLVAMWRPWPTGDQNPVKDFYCGKSGNGLFFKFEHNPVVPKKPFYQLLARNWKVLENENYHFKEQEINPCASTTEDPLTITDASVVDVSYLSGSATLTWLTNIPATSQVEVTNISTGAIIQSNANATLEKNHVVTITGLAPNMLYSIKGISTTPGGQTAISDERAFNTEEPLVITDAQVVSVSYANGSATLNWATNIAANSQVEVTNIATGTVLQSSVDPNLFFNHTVIIAGLTPNTLYSIRGISVSPGGQTAVSAESSFKTENTLAIANVLVSNLSPQGGSATLSWATNIAATGQVEVINTVTGAVSQSAVDSNLAESHIISIAGLAPNTIYRIRGISTTPGGQTAVSAENTFSIEDILQITGITIASVSFADSSATLNWLTDIPATGQVELTDVLTGIVARSALDINLSINHTMVITGLMPGTTYNIRGVSTTPGGQTVFSDPITFRTEDLLTISVLSITETSRLTRSAKFVWNTNIPSTSQGEGRNVVTGVVNQSIFDPTLVLSHSAEVTDLLANTLYGFRGISTTPGGQIMYTNEIVVRMPR